MPLSLATFATAPSKSACAFVIASDPFFKSSVLNKSFDLLDAKNWVCAVIAFWRAFLALSYCFSVSGFTDFVFSDLWSSKYWAATSNTATAEIRSSRFALAYSAKSDSKALSLSRRAFSASSITFWVRFAVWSSLSVAFARFSASVRALL